MLDGLVRRHSEKQGNEVEEKAGEIAAAGQPACRLL